MLPDIAPPSPDDLLHHPLASSPISYTTAQDIPLARRSLTAAALRRGDISISEPIPWLEGIPQTPPVATSLHRAHTSASPLSPRDPDPEHHAHTPLASHFTEDFEAKEHDFGPLDARPPDTVFSFSPGQHAPGSPDPPFAEDMFADRRASSGGQRRGSEERRKARRSGTIRGVFRKVFGRKDKGPEAGAGPEPHRGGPKHEYHRSDPGILTPTPAPNAQRAHTASPLAPDFASSPTPVLPFPMNVNAPDPSSPTPPPAASAYLSFETAPQVHRRRATLPSLIMTPAESAHLERLWADPASYDPFAAPLPSPMIGVALTSNVSKRRSRSAGALGDLARLHARHPPVPFPFHRDEDLVRPRTAGGDREEWRRPGTAGGTGDGDWSRPNMAGAAGGDDWQRPDTAGAGRTDTRLSSECRTTEAATSIAAPVTAAGRGFDFRDFSGGSSAPGGGEDVAAVEQRLSQLEVNMLWLSRSLQRLSGEAPAGGAGFHFGGGGGLEFLGRQEEGAVRGRPGGGLHFANKSMTALEVPRLRARVALSPPPAPRGVVPERGDVRAPPSPSSTASSGRGFAFPARVGRVPAGRGEIVEPMVEQLAPLYSALRYERTVRKTLETRVGELQRDVRELSACVARMRSVEGFEAPAGVGRGRGSLDAKERSRFSGFDESDVDGEGEEGWTTPRLEEGPQRWVAPVEGGMF